MAPLLTIPLDVLGQQCAALIDSGAGGNFISYSFVKRLRCPLHKLKNPESVRVASGEILPITHFARLYLKMGELTIRCSLHVTKSTGEIILGYPFLTRFEPLIHWKDRYMEISHKNVNFRIFCIPAKGSLYESTIYHPKNQPSPFHQLQTSNEFSRIHNRLDTFQTSLQKLQLLIADLPKQRADTHPFSAQSRDGPRSHSSPSSPSHASNIHIPQKLLPSTQCDTKALDARCDRPLTCTRLDSSPHPSLNQNKSKPSPKPIPETIEISAEEQAEIEALLPQTPTTTPKLLPALKEKQIKEEPIPTTIQQLLSKYQNVFEDHPNTLPKQRDTDHVIELVKDAKIPTHRIYRLTPDQDDELKKQLDKYLAAGQIERSYSPFGASTLFAKKKDGTQRLCIDYRALNDITIKDVYPLPRIDEIIDKFARCKYFSKIDLQQGFHQIRLHPDSVKKTAFQTKYGSFHFLVMPFGLCNAPATFQRTMNLLLHDVSNTNVFIDDITVYSETLEEHKQHLEHLLKRLQQEQFYAKRTKCSFAQPEIEFCGYIVGRYGVRTMPEKLQLIHDWLTPTSAQDIRRFLGLTGFYQKFITNYAKKAEPLTKLLRKTNPFEWTDTQENAFATLKHDMMHSATLTYPDMDKVFLIHTDASDIAVGATLSQEDKYGQLKLVACGSRKLNDAEKNYPPHEQECLAVIDALRRWKYYFRQPPKVFTDNITLKYLKTMKDPSKRMIRWIAELADYSPIIQHIPGSTNTAADAISRQVHLHFLNSISFAETLLHKHLPLCPLEPTNTDNSQTLTPPIDPNNWLPDYATDSWYLKHCISTDADGNDGLDPKYETFNQRIWLGDRILVPQTRVTEVIDTYHNGILQGHWGIAKTIAILKRKYFIPGITKHVQQHVTNCPQCQRIKIHKQKQRGLLVQLFLPTQKWQSVSMDWINFPRNPRLVDTISYDTVLIFTDRATKMVHLIPTTMHTTSDETAQLFIKHVVKYHGIPRSIHSDRDPRLSSALWSELCQKLDIKHKMTAAYWPQANGQAERTNQTVKQLLRFAHDEGLHWFDALDSVEMTINNAPIAQTSYSPYFLNYGFHPTLIPDVYDETIPTLQATHSTPREFMDRLSYDWKVAQSALSKLKEQQKHDYDLHKTFATLRVGDLVLVKISDPRLQSLGGSLAAPTSGPYLITDEIVPNTTYRVAIPDHIFKGNKSFHISKLIPWHGAAPGCINLPSTSNTTSPSPSQHHDSSIHLSPSETRQRFDNNGQPIPPTHHAHYLPEIRHDTYPQDSQEAQPGSPQPTPPTQTSDTTYCSPPTLEEYEQQLSPEPSYDPLAPTQTSSTQTNIPSQPTFDLDLEDENYDDQEDIDTFATDAHTPHPTVDLSSLSPRRHHKPKTQHTHVHFNPNVDIFLIPKRFCTFPFIRPPKQKRTSWKHIAQTDCEQVKLNPAVFRKSISQLKFKPSADLFASSTHHQLPRYYSKDYDPKAVRTNAFSIDWNLESHPYVNPPWSLIPKVLNKVENEQVKIMLVIPHWPHADWYPQFQRMHIRSIILEDPIYLDDQGNLRPKPSWNTQIAIIQG